MVCSITRHAVPVSFIFSSPVRVCLPSLTILILPDDKFRRVMMKNFSMADLGEGQTIATLVRAASKLSIEELAVAMDGTEEEAKSIKTVGNFSMINEAYHISR